NETVQRHIYAGTLRLEQITEHYPGNNGQGNMERKLYVHVGVMGTSIRYSKDNGNQFAAIDYDLFGAAISPSKLNNNDKGLDILADYTGYTFDYILDKYFAQYRFYDANNRHFMAKDPIKSGLNWYAYVGNNPVTWVDPWGLMPRDMLNTIKQRYVYEGIPSEQVFVEVISANLPGGILGKDELFGITAERLAEKLDGLDLSASKLTSAAYLSMHEMAQVFAAKEISSNIVGGSVVFLEYPLSSLFPDKRGEIDIYSEGMVWEVKPLAQSKRRMTDSLNKYVFDPLTIRGSALTLNRKDPLVFTLFTLLGHEYRMGIVSNAPGFVQYYFEKLYKPEPVPEWRRVENPEMARDMVRVFDYLPDAYWNHNEQPRGWEFPSLAPLPSPQFLGPVIAGAAFILWLASGGAFPLFGY
ncbi:MAG: RHS repeat-associated core domain-containing protein, partial [Symbiobacteriaceae bacterium]|nr:RHS repeat-associated core domain-containing protein [Symbiobacteriaceae bacterium]